MDRELTHLNFNLHLCGELFATMFVNSWSILSVDLEGNEASSKTSDDEELDVTYDDIAYGRSELLWGDIGRYKLEPVPLPRVEMGSSDSIKASITTISRWLVPEVPASVVLLIWLWTPEF